MLNNAVSSAIEIRLSIKPLMEICTSYSVNTKKKTSIIKGSGSLIRLRVDFKFSPWFWCYAKVSLKDLSLEEGKIEESQLEVRKDSKTDTSFILIASNLSLGLRLAQVQEEF